MRDRPQTDRREPQPAGAGQQQRNRDHDEHRLADLVLLARDVGERPRDNERERGSADFLGLDVDPPLAGSGLDGPDAGLRRPPAAASASVTRSSCTASGAPLRVENRDGITERRQSRSRDLGRGQRGAVELPSSSRSRFASVARTLSSSRSARRMPRRCCTTSTSTPNSSEHDDERDRVPQRQPRAKRERLHAASPVELVTLAAAGADRATPAPPPRASGGAAGCTRRRRSTSDRSARPRRARRCRRG